MSTKLVKMLKRHEGYRRLPYEDSVGVLTIGVGRSLEMGLSDDEVEYLLQNDIDRTIEELDRNFEWFADLNDARQDAMIDIGFNLGLTRLLKFEKALKAMAEGDFELAALEFLDSRWAIQVKGRAQELAAMIQTGRYVNAS